MINVEFRTYRQFFSALVISGVVLPTALLRADQPYITAMRLLKLNGRKLEEKATYVFFFDTSKRMQGEAIYLHSGDGKTRHLKGSVTATAEWEEFAIKWSNGNNEMIDLSIERNDREKQVVLLNMKTRLHSDESKNGRSYLAQIIASNTSKEFLKSAAWIGFLNSAEANLVFRNKRFPSGAYDAYVQMRLHKMKTDGQITKDSLR